MSNATLIQQINTPVTGTLAVSFTSTLQYYIVDYGQFLGFIYTDQGSEIGGNYFTGTGLSGSAGGAAVDDIANGIFSAAAASLALLPTAVGATGGSGQYGFYGNGLLYDPNLPAGGVQGTDFGPGNGGDGGAATLALTSTTIGSVAGLYSGNIVITAAATGGAGGIGGDGDYPTVVAAEEQGGVIFGPDAPPNGQGGGNGGDGGVSTALLDALDTDSSSGTTIVVKATGGAGGQGGTGAGPGDYYTQGGYSAVGVGGTGGDGGDGGDASASIQNANVNDTVSILVTVDAVSGAGGAGGTGGAPGFVPVGSAEGSVSAIADIAFTAPGSGGNGGDAGSAVATVSDSVFTAPQVEVSVIAESGSAGEGGSPGLLPADATFPPYFNGDTYETEYIYTGLAPGVTWSAATAVGTQGAVAASQIAFTNNTVNVTAYLSLTFHVEQPAGVGTPVLQALNGAAGGNLVFSGNSFIGDGSSELDLQGTGSDATVDDLAGTISIAGSPGNSMTGFDVFDLGDGDTFNAGTQPSTVVRLAPDPDTIVLTPGHGAIVLQDATSTNLLLDFQGYGSTFDSLAQLEADTTTYASYSVINLPGDGAITVIPEYYDGWTPSAANTDLMDTTDTFSDQVSTAGAYLWSNAANWSAGLPASDANVVVDGDGIDDIPSLMVPFVTLNAAVTVADATLTVTGLAVTTSAQLLVDSGSSVTISGAISGTGATLAADGTGAVLKDLASTDPGETYQVSNGGEVNLAASVSYLSTLNYDPIGTPGTFVLTNPADYEGATLGNVAPGDVLEVAGTGVQSLTLDINNGALDLATDAGGLYDFNNVTYNTAVAGISTAIEPAGLLAITFTAGDTFSDNDAIDSAYLWSDGKNWSNEAPPSGGDAFMYASGTDDIAALTLASLGLTDNATLDVTANLTVDALLLGPGATVVVSNGATLSIQGPVTGANNAVLQADGAGSLLFDNAPSDPGETYEASNGGTVVLTAEPLIYQSELQYDPAGSVGTFVLTDPGIANLFLIGSLQPGDVLELPGTTVLNVTFDADASALSIMTDAGTFAGEAYYPQPLAIAGYTASAGLASGLVAITFTAGDTFNDNDVELAGPDAGNYVWSDALNWSSGVPTTSADVYMYFSGIDDVAGLVLGSVGLTDNISLTVEANLTAGTVSLGQGSAIDVGAGATFDITGVAGVPGGALQASGTGAVLSDAGASDPGENYAVSDGGEVMLAAPPSAASVLSYDPAGTSGTFALSHPGAAIAAALENIGVGDVLELPGVSVTDAVATTASLTIETDAGTYSFTDVDFLPGVGRYQAVDLATGLVAVTFVDASDLTATPLCFLANTLIATPDGETPVEQLCAGDMVLTASGEARRIVWIGTGRVLATRGRRNAATPVIVRKGALADNVPHRDLRVTKGHSLFFDDVLIPVEFLVNHRSILWDDHAQEVTIYHLELDTHDVILANGAPAESYRDDGNRWLFRNANTGWGLPPKPSCAPVLTGGHLVDTIWRRLLDRAGPRPGTPLTDDPDLHLLVDGMRVEASAHERYCCVFNLPPSPTEIRVSSRAAAQQELGLTRDPRCLGVALRQIVVQQRTRFRTLQADDERLVNGFHAYEVDNDFRWTNGDAVLPADLLDGFSGPCELRLTVGCTTQYINRQRLHVAA